MTTGGFPDATVINFRHALLSAHNSMRQTYGNRHALKIDTSLNGTAQNWANKMAAANSLQHGGLTGKAYGQNIAGGQTTVASVMSGWRHSCGHFYNIVFPYWTIIGFGISKARNGTYYWCADFGGGSRSLCFSDYCPNATCNGVSGHDFYSNDHWKPSS